MLKTFVQKMYCHEKKEHLTSMWYLSDSYPISKLHFKIHKSYEFLQYQTWKINF